MASCTHLSTGIHCIFISSRLPVVADTTDKPSKGSVTRVKQPPFQRGELRKAVDAVYAYPQQGKLTLVGRKAFNLLLANAMEQGVERDWYEIEIGELAKDIRYDSNDIKRLETTLNEMQRTLVKWNALETINDETVPVRDSVQLLGAVRLIGGVAADGTRVTAVARSVRYQFDPRVKQRLLVPEVYARINLQLQATFKSAFALAMYEQLIRYRSNVATDGWAYTVKLPWREWRSLILGGDYSAMYETYKYFGRDVLTKSLKELNERVSDQEFEVLVFKEGRQISDLQFRLRDRVQSTLEFAHDEPLIDTSGVARRLEAFEITKSEVNRLIRLNDLFILEEAAGETQLRLRRGDLNPVRNKSAYFMNALARIKERMRTGVSPANELDIEAEEGKPVAKKPKAASTKKSVAASAPIEPEVLSWGDIESWFLALNDVRQQELIDQFIDQERNPAVVAAYAKQQFKSAMVKVAFAAWATDVLRAENQ